MTNDEKAALATYGLDQMLESLRRDIADRGPCTPDDYAHMVATLQEAPRARMARRADVDVRDRSGPARAGRIVTAPLTAGEAAELDTARPALDPPPLKPRRDFDLSEVNTMSIAAELIAEILMDDERHPIEDVIEEVVYETELGDAAAHKLLRRMQAHGDVRINAHGVRLTTRWQEYRA